MTVPKLPPFDSKGFAERLKEAIPKRPDGTIIKVWDQLPPWVLGVRGLRDNVASHDVQLTDHKIDLDTHSADIANLKTRVKALEEAPPSPFPG